MEKKVIEQIKLTMVNNGVIMAIYSDIGEEERFIYDNNDTLIDDIRYLLGVDKKEVVTEKKEEI
jgi:hypothetical protein